MVHTSFELKTADGVTRTEVFHPDGAGPWPAVICYMDGIGMRPAIHRIAARIAEHGYFVVAPDLFYRLGEKIDPDEVKASFADPAKRQAWFAKMSVIATPALIMRDTQAVLDYLAGEKRVKGAKVGTTGYCMGGLMSLTAAGTFPDRVAAAASFHGGRLASDAPDSPANLAKHMKAKVYVAGAIEDASFTDEMKKRLDDALTAAGVDHVVETYEGCRHGWVPDDTAVHNPAGAERHFANLLPLFDRVLKA